MKPIHLPSYISKISTYQTKKKPTYAPDLFHGYRLRPNTDRISIIIMNIVRHTFPRSVCTQEIAIR